MPRISAALLLPSRLFPSCSGPGLDAPEIVIRAETFAPAASVSLGGAEVQPAANAYPGEPDGFAGDLKTVAVFEELANGTAIRGSQRRGHGVAAASLDRR